ncbi:M56 family metallopeptidase [Streptomyces sp. NPDC050428]|uniref:M56 family metallopeptidase n=1 Tax=Streptomyces sp. NPDC050428 TaxID=3155757 RepID=UPI003416DE70
MNAAPALLGYAAAVGVLAPRVMLRGGWPHRAPVLAAAVWFALGTSFSVCVALAALHLATPGAHLHGILYSCGVALGVGPPDAGAVRRLGVGVSAAVPTAQLAAFAHHALRARAARSRHRAILDKVGRPSASLGATVLDHMTPTAYCLPGHRSRIVVSSGAVDLLTETEIAAVVAHERVHIAGRHHLLLAAARAFAVVFRGVPLARHLGQQIPLLLEMAADDGALRRHPHRTLVTAMFEMASAGAVAKGAVPKGALSAGGRTVPIRLRRILAPARRTRPAFRAVVAGAAVLMPLLPLLLACPPGLA